MNPYDFVRIDWSKPPQRRAAPPQDRFTGWSGRIEGRVVAETPLFVQGTVRGGPGPKQFQTNAEGTPIIPGSSLKGLFRSLVETVGPGCWWLYDGRYRDRIDYRQQLPQAFRQCPGPDGLCPACRLFGLVRSNTLLLGKVGFDDALCTQTVSHSSIYTPILDAPKPRHSAWYLDRDGRWVSGRKFYFHQGSIRTEGALRTSRSGEALNQHIEPLDEGTEFLLTGHFSNLADDEFPSLLYALVLEQCGLGHERDLRHKLGYAKPAGLGSVRIQLTRLTRWQAAGRYTGETAETYEGDALQAFVNQHIVQYVADTTSVTLQDLRRIWRWPPAGSYQYPDRGWFTAHSTDPISKTP